MLKKIHILVADDQKKQARSKLYETMSHFGEQSSYPPPWHLSVAEDDLEITCEFVSDSQEAKQLLMNSEAIQRFDMILLDNDWYGDATWGVEMIKELHQRDVHHPALILFTQHDVIPFLSDAFKHGVMAVIKKGDHAHLLNTLLNVAQNRASSFSTS